MGRSKFTRREGEEVNKITVTEAQAKVIEHELNKCREIVFDMRTDIFISIKHKTDLDIVTIARIVEGETYEVKRGYKVGDIVLRNGMLYEVLEVNVHLVDDRCTLVCKAENREDLAHE